MTAAEDRAFLAALLPLSRTTLRRFRLLVSPDTVLRWHRDLAKHRHALASMNCGPGRPRTLASIRRLVLRLATENPSRANGSIIKQTTDNFVARRTAPSQCRGDAGDDRSNGLVVHAFGRPC